MKRKSVIFVAFILVALLASCSENPGTTTMKLLLSTASGSNAKTLSPDDSSLMDVSKYVITGIGPNGKTFTKSSDSTSVSIEGLTIGEWTVTAKGLNSSNTEIVSGTLTFHLTATTSSQTIVLDTLIGTGTFSFTVDWTACDVADPRVEAFLKGPDMDGVYVALPVTQNDGAKTASMSESLASGSYLLRVLLYDGTKQVVGLVEAVRISNGTVSEGNCTFLFNELGPNISLHIKDATGVPMKGTLSIANSPSEFVSNTEYTCNFTFSQPEKVNTEGLTIEWYYDGELKSTSSLDSSGSSYSFTPTIGSHRIDAVVYNKKLGSTCSASYTMDVIPNGKKGELILVNANANGTLSVASDSMIGAVSGDRFIVVTPSAGKMYVCTVSSGALNIAKEYSVSNFAWLEDTKHLFTSTKMNYLVLSDNYNGTGNITCLSFDSSSNTLTQLLRCEGKIGPYNVALKEASAATFRFTEDQILVADAGTEMIHTIDINDGAVYAYQINYKLKGGAYSNISDMDSSPDGSSSMVYVANSSTSFVSATYTEKGAFIDPMVSAADSYGGKYTRYVNNQLLVKASSGGLTTYKVVSGDSYTKYKSIEKAVSNLIADGSNYFYAVCSGNRIESYEVTGYEISYLGSVSLEANSQSIALSSSYFATVTSAGAIALYGIIK